MSGLGKLRIGTSSFTAAGWRGTFYPDGMKQADYLGYYATEFDTVEIDSTWYAPPSERTVLNWAAQTPEHFTISAKVPQVITHERCLEDCDLEMSSFLKVMERLGSKLGVLLFQFPYFNRDLFATPEPFLKRLEPFLKKLPTSFRFAIELRNKSFLVPALRQLLDAHQVAIAVVDHPWMPTAKTWFKTDPVTAPIAYVRLLGDRYEIEEKTKTWDRVVVDRSREIGDWTGVCEKITQRGVDVFVYINNHYAGHAPASVRQFLQQWQERHKSGTMAASDTTVQETKLPLDASR
jgi:uncharacterized protein YecE (DUF72 family)